MSSNGNSQVPFKPHYVSNVQLYYVYVHLSHSTTIKVHQEYKKIVIMSSPTVYSWLQYADNEGQHDYYPVSSINDES